MEIHTSFVLLVIALALLFDFTNGFHDAGNSIATIVATKVLTPIQAVIWAAFFNLMAFFIFKLAVANTIGSGLIEPDLVTPYLIFSTLIAALAWNMITWFYGLPSSSSHALIGGLAGAAIAKAGIGSLIFSGFAKVLIAILITPFIGVFFGLSFVIFISKITKKHQKSGNLKIFKYLQLISSALLSMTHGGNDAQKTMGIIAILLYSSSWLGDTFYVPFWVVITCYLVIALGTLAGGWRIVHTMGYKITQLDSLKGCAAESSAAAVIFSATEIGVPVSTTHIVTGSIAGVGMAQGFFSIQWIVMRKIFITWVLTIPATAGLAAIIGFTISLFLKGDLL